MYGVYWVRSLPGSFASIVFVFSGAIGLSLIGAGSAFAIPSPELIVGSFVSLSQLFALASAILGGGAAYATLHTGRRGALNLSRSLMIGAAAVAVLLIASVGSTSTNTMNERTSVRRASKTLC